MKVLVTGGAGGIGLAIARAFQGRGDTVLVSDVSDDALAAARVSGLLATHCDAENRAQIDALFDTVSRELGGLDVLVNNVGIGGPTLPAEQLPSEDWARVMAVNLTSTFETTRRAIPLLKASRGVVIVMSSAAGRFGYPNRIAYATSKWGLIGFTKTLSRELGPDGISVNAILPGAVGGDRFDRVIQGRAALSGRSFAEEVRAGLVLQSLEHVVPPEHIADLALFLTSPAGRSISGQALPIDGDLQMG